MNDKNDLTEESLEQAIKQLQTMALDIIPNRLYVNDTVIEICADLNLTPQQLFELIQNER